MSTRLAILGGGAIADFHAPACRRAGFELAAVSSSPGSTTVAGFAERHGVAQVFDGPGALLAAREAWDAVLIAVPTVETLEVFEAALDTGAPILVEKPVALRSADLEPFMGRDLPVIVGYNRRFYRPAREARERAVADPPPLAHLQLPEGIAAPEEPDRTRRYLENLFINSVHGLDLAAYVLGGLEVETVARAFNAGGNIVGLKAMMRSPEGTILSLDANWGVPANYALALDWPGRRLELRPFEVAALYEGMEVHEPTPETPVRRYLPKVVETVQLDPVDAELKPGFAGQAEAFMRLCRGEDPAPAARLEDAHVQLRICEALAGGPLEV